MSYLFAKNLNILSNHDQIYKFKEEIYLADPNISTSIAEKLANLLNLRIFRKFV